MTPREGPGSLLGMQNAVVQVIAHLTIQAEHVEQALAVLRTLARSARAAVGNQRFEVLQHASEPTRLATLETWQDAAAADGHMTADYVGAALAQLGPLLACPPAIERYAARA